MRVVTDGQEVERTLPATDSLEARRRQARLLRTTYPWSMPTLLDRPDDAVGRAYGSWPLRVVVVDATGDIAFSRGGMAGLGVGTALETWLARHLGPLAGTRPHDT